MKLCFIGAGYGHLELAENDVVQDGIFAGLTQRQLFERIMREGYSGKIPPVFHTEFKNGEVVMFTGAEAQALIGRPDVETVTIMAPLCGGQQCPA